MDTTFSELEAALDDAPLSQGDVFEWTETSDDPFLQRGIIVTADCDLAHGKHGERLSYVPLLTVSEYLRLFVMPGLIERATRPVFDQCSSLIHLAQRQYKPEFPEPISTDAIEEWLKRESATRIASALGVPPGDERFELERAIDAVRTARTATSRGLRNQVESLLEVRARQGGDPKKLRVRLKEEIRQRLVSLPGDCLFLGAADLARCGGHVAYLRLVREIAVSEIAIRSPELRREYTRAKRVARLRSPYIYRLTQQLGDVFAAIGLPDEYEEGRDSAMATIWDEWPDFGNEDNRV